MPVERFEIQTVHEGDETLEEVEIFDGTEDFDGHVVVKSEKPTCQIKVLKFFFGLAVLILVFSFGYKLGTDEMAMNPFFTNITTQRPTIPPATQNPTTSPSMIPTRSPTIPNEEPTIPTEIPTISPTNETDSNSTRL